MHTWLQSFLSNRKQYDDSVSNVLNIEMGVPKVSTLVPFLFILCFIDVHRALSSMKVIHFADDSTIYVRYDKNTEISQVVIEELNSISNLLSTNKLFLNVTKTKYNIFLKKYVLSREIMLTIQDKQILNSLRFYFHDFLDVSHPF